MNEDVWWNRANCKGMDTSIFFPEVKPGRYHLDRLEVAAARSICAGCVVREECLDDALSLPRDLDVFGGAILAGTTPREREAMRRNRAQSRSA